jgi:putative monooxygenase
MHRKDISPQWREIAPDMHSAPATKVANHEIQPSTRIGGEVRILLSPMTVQATDGFLGTITIGPGDYVAEQYHPFSDKFFYLVRGSAAIRVNGERIDLQPDDAIMVRRGQRHRIDNLAGEEVFLVFQICPLAPKPELGHVDTEPLPNPHAAPPQVGSTR